MADLHRSWPKRIAESPTLDFPLGGSGPCSSLACAMGFATFARIAEYIRRLPYGRIEADRDGLAVLRAGKGTCSSKHRFLALLAHECGRTDVMLTLGLYKMSALNTPGIGPILIAAQLDSIPEAHCYLTCGGHRYDFTGLPPGTLSPFDALIEERTVSPRELPAIKVRYHQDKLSRWAEEVGINSARAWQLREQCIHEITRKLGGG